MSGEDREKSPSSNEDTHDPEEKAENAFDVEKAEVSPNHHDDEWVSGVKLWIVSLLSFLLEDRSHFNGTRLTLHLQDHDWHHTSLLPHATRYGHIEHCMS